MAEQIRTLDEAGSTPGRAVCRICGTEFDSTRYQVVIAELGDAPFDRIACADIALADRRRTQSELEERRKRRRRAR
jgi:hypothetical protein